MFYCFVLLFKRKTHESLRTISQIVASLNMLVHDVINLLYTDYSKTW